MVHRETLFQSNNKNKIKLKKHHYHQQKIMFSSKFLNLILLEYVK